jgi:hypothetical protein
MRLKDHHWRIRRLYFPTPVLPPRFFFPSLSYRLRTAAFKKQIREPFSGFELTVGFSVHASWSVGEDVRGFRGGGSEQQPATSNQQAATSSDKAASSLSHIRNGLRYSVGIQGC